MKTQFYFFALLTVCALPMYTSNMVLPEEPLVMQRSSDGRPTLHRISSAETVSYSQDIAPVAPNLFITGRNISIIRTNSVALPEHTRSLAQRLRQQRRQAQTKRKNTTQALRTTLLQGVINSRTGRRQILPFQKHLILHLIKQNPRAHCYFLNVTQLRKDLSKSNPYALIDAIHRSIAIEIFFKKSIQKKENSGNQMREPEIISAENFLHFLQIPLS